MRGHCCVRGCVAGEDIADMYPPPHMTCVAGEDIADMGGVKVSYKALQALTQEQAADASRHGGLSGALLTLY